MPLDFRADRVQTKALIADRSSGAKLIIYPSDAKLDNNGGIDPTKLPPAQYEADDVFIFISGSIGGLDGADNGVSVFGGDVYVSGSLAGETLIFNNLVGEQVMVNFVPILNVDQVLGQKVYFSQVGDIATYSGQVEYKSVAPGNSVLTINLSANGLVEVPAYTGEVSGVSSTHYAESALALGTNSSALIYEESGDQYIYIISDSVGADGVHSVGFTISFRNPMGSASGGGGGGGGGDASDWSLYPALQSVDIGHNRITNIATPINLTDAATKGYVDDLRVLSSPDNKVRIGVVETTTPEGEPIGGWAGQMYYMTDPANQNSPGASVGIHPFEYAPGVSVPMISLVSTMGSGSPESCIVMMDPSGLVVIGSLGVTATPIAPHHVATKAYVDARPGAEEWSEHPATQDVALDGHKLTGLGEPTEEEDAATKGYVDAELGFKANTADLGQGAFFDEATVEQAQLLTTGNRVMTPRRMADALNAQSWQDMSASRQLNATYTNVTHRPIFVSVSVNIVAMPSGVGKGYLVLWVNQSGSNLPVARFVLSPSAGSVPQNEIVTIQGFVPAGAEYNLVGDPDVYDQYGAVWHEYR